MKWMWRDWHFHLVVLVNPGVATSALWFFMLWFWVKYNIYRIGGGIGWCVVRGIEYKVYKDFFYGVGSDVGGDFESCAGLKSKLGVCYGNCISLSQFVKYEVNEGVGEGTVLDLDMGVSD